MIELCRSVGFIPTLYRGTVDSILASVDLVAEQRCVMCAPASCLPAPSGVVWRSLVAPVSRYPWSVLWRAGDSSQHVSALVDAARALFERLGWRNPLGQLIPILGVLSALVMSRALIRPFPTPPCMVP